ncbi:MoaD/ThiS family protein [Lactobacillus sp. CC-MHH1034]|uniref:MoaD/ThiS family protein n=1 Tax=Agrilactobacillus fermenti TaxID=2586909 RepID=UPI001E5A5D46|nr:MoaD/ThiS family protein [Agrilactobacillus fermenti]MCD2255663.1 MoaD/ThiS family protein [Agrilactobacillus fermenti]
MLQIKLFAYLQEMLAADEISVAVTEKTLTAAQIKQLIAQAYPKIASYLPNTRLAVDQVFINDAQTIDLTARHEFALIPPVSGG